MRLAPALGVLACLGLGTSQAATFPVTLAPEHAREPLDGRLLLLLSVDGSKEPRFQIDVGTNSPPCASRRTRIWRRTTATASASPATTELVLGYPKPICNKRTGAIDRSVASYWRDNYDLVHIMQRDWEKGLGAEHCWNGDPTRPNSQSRLRYLMQYSPAAWIATG